MKFSKALAALEGIAEAYVSRRVNLTAFAPDSVAATLDEALPSHVTSLQLAVDPTASGEVAQGRQLEVVG